MHSQEVAILGAFVLFLLPPWLTTRDIWRQPAMAWSACGRSRWAWTLAVLLLPVIGPVLYLRRARPDVRATARG